jgi:hypothetical protein
MEMEMNNWKPIETAPKDGTLIEITALQANGEPFEIWPMQWGHIQQNGLFPDQVGMWVTPDGAATWVPGSEEQGGPTHWRSIKRMNDNAIGIVHLLP